MFAEVFAFAGGLSVPLTIKCAVGALFQDCAPRFGTIPRNESWEAYDSSMRSSAMFWWCFSWGPTVFWRCVGDVSMMLWRCLGDDLGILSWCGGDGSGMFRWCLCDVSVICRVGLGDVFLWCIGGVSMMFRAIFLYAFWRRCYYYSLSCGSMWIRCSCWSAPMRQTSLVINKNTHTRSDMTRRQ